MRIFFSSIAGVILGIGTGSGKEKPARYVKSIS